eukprot:CAMPEP_0178416624 /NCGR_PEP_ID=MMETSP0689_2-20121128/24159_1 /TAXON_ID=160604 /ORGANISM="Amphidinium massartii, Strain CS-259" /LENGTH=223 /DNA_ID=CAMNT_0020037973 /DNA_START=244 /DNA_END=915 /DNA_ORIENTATION=+
MIFRHGGIEYEDEFVTFAEWSQVKPKMPNGQVPVIRMADGSMIGDTPVIAKHAASLAPEKLACENPAREADAAAIWEEDGTTTAPWCQPPDMVSLDNCLPHLNFFPADVAEKRMGPEMCNLHKMASIWFKHLEGRLEGGPFLFGASRPCHADFIVFARMNNMADLSDTVIEKEAPASVKAFYEAMLALPAVSGYLAQRPASGGSWGMPGSILATYTNTAKRIV